jgi:type II secretory ATPase GspE/PulE/Tfp pilus assembly ATPase PilB-like protein
VSIASPRLTGPAKVSSASVVLVDGTAHAGHLPRFDANSVDVALDIDPPRGGPRKRLILAAERIAYVGFLGEADDRETLVAAGAPRCRVHAGSRSFTVLVQCDAPSPLGFFGVPLDAESPFERIFFYEHGIDARELDRPIGELLVERGLVSAADVERASTEQLVRRAAESTLEQVLAESGVLGAEQFARARTVHQQKRGRRLGEILVEMGLVTEGQLTEVLARKFDLPVVDLVAVPPDPRVADALPEHVVGTHGVVPYATSGDILVVAIRDPLASQALAAIREHAKRKVATVLARGSQLDAAVDRYLSRRRAEAVDDGATIDQVRKLLEADPSEEREEASITVVDESENAVIRLVNRIIIDAYRRGASDIHIEPNGRGRSTDVRFRIDGDCLPYTEIPPGHRASVVARIKIMARLDIAERRKPQDGKIVFRLPEKQIELRVATLPTVGGNEDVVMRILADSKPIPLDRMDMKERNLRELRALVEKPYGLLLCVGPTGSGKTTTLHSALSEINRVDVKIWTAEDPVEITQPGLRQVQVHPKVGLSFASAIRAFLRADPDVIMIGEMRDEETASTAVECSLTGHLVFSTLHTNSSAETVTRLLDMGLDPFAFADSLLGILAQRLCRRVCSCRELRPADPTELRDLAAMYGEGFDALIAARSGEVTLPVARGCERCAHTGYKGRIALHELLVVGESIREAIVRRESATSVRTLAIAGGMTTLRQDGIEKCLSGHTDLVQVVAVCGR